MAGKSRFRPHAASITHACATGTDASTDFIMYGTGYDTFGVATVMAGTTKDVTVALQGTIGDSTSWTALMAGDVATTGAWAMVNTTAGLVVDRVRLGLTGNDSTSTGTSVTAWVVPKGA